MGFYNKLRLRQLRQLPPAARRLANSRDSHCGKQRPSKDTLLHSTPVLPNPTPFWASSDNDNSLHTLWGASLWGCDGSRASCLPTAIIIRHLNNFRFHAAPLSPGTRRLARFPTLDGYQPPPWQSLRPANPKLCGVCAIFLRPASHIISAHHQHLIATNNAATLGCTLLLLMHEGSLQNGAQREAT